MLLCFIYYIDINNNILFRQVLFDSRLQSQIYKNSLFDNSIRKFKKKMKDAEKEIEKNTGLLTDIVKYEIVKYL